MADNDPLFKNIDEYERTYAPEELPKGDPERSRVTADEQSAADPSDRDEAPGPAPVGALGTSPSGAMAPPNIGHEDHGGAPGDPETQAREPMEPDQE